MKLKKLCSIALLVISGGGAVLSAIQLVPYIREEAQSASTYRDLAAFFSGEDVDLEDVQDNPSSTFNSYGASDGAAVGMDSSAEEALPSDGDANELIEQSTDEVQDDEDEAAEDGTPAWQSDPETASRLQALHEKNSDCVAWIRIDDTAINYPVMYRPQSKNYYLHRDFYGKKSSSGALYISEICDPDTSDNVIIYGHHMNSGSMFAALNKYKKKSFYEDHKQIVLQTLHGTEVYEVIFALTTPVYTGKDFKYYAFANARNAREFDTYVSNCRARALYNTGGTAQYGDRLLTLSTCEYSQRNGRMLVVAKKVN